MTPSPPPQPPRLAVVADRSATVRAHARIPDLLRNPALVAGPAIELYWLATSAIVECDDLAGFDGIWVAPGSPYDNADGVLAAVEAARTTMVPFLGTCGGFQYMAIEFARNVCGLGPVGHGETDPESTDLLIEPLQCSLVGEERTVEVMAGTTVAAAMGAGPSTERFFCSYGLAARHVPTLEAHGLVVSARDEAGEVRAVELPGHPWFVGSLWQPELSSDPTWVHPLITGFANAVRSHAQRTAPATVGSIGG